MLRTTVESYRHLASSVGHRRARRISRAELVARGARRLAGPGWNSVQTPSLDQLMGAMRVADSGVTVLAWAGVDASRAAELATEFEVVAKELQAAYHATALSCPPEWAVEANTSLILFSLVRALQPDHVVETGIANGHSSFVILAAMQANQRGRLTSFDVRHDVGSLVRPDFAERWSKVVIDDQRPGLDLMQQRLEDRHPVDLFFHDGDHRFLGQVLDYALARRVLAPNGILLSDDVNSSAAWLDACLAGDLGSDPMVLMDRRKVIGCAHPRR